jgi:hypothetical protein
MRAFWEVDVQIHALLTWALVGGEWPASLPGRFISGEKASGTRWIGDWVGPRAVWPTWRRENSCDSNSDPSVVQPVASRYTDRAIPAPACISTVLCFEGTARDVSFLLTKICLSFGVFGWAPFSERTLKKKAVSSVKILMPTYRTTLDQGTRRHLRGYVKVKKIYIISCQTH